MPNASPLITITPARARSAASFSATASPYGEGRREPTIATRGPAGGGQRPRARKSERSGGGIVEAVSQCFQDMALGDGVGRLKVGGRKRHAPGAMKATCSQAAMF